MPRKAAKPEDPKPRKKRTIKISPELAETLTPEKLEMSVPKASKRSQAWKGLEYAIATAFRVAGFLKAKRILKNDQILAASQHKELPDVNIPEAPFLKIDGKHSIRTWDKVESLFLACQKKYALEPQDRFVLVTQKANSRHRIAHINLEFLAELCAKAYLDGKTSDTWVCPQCRSHELFTTPIGMGQELTRCNTCTLEWVTKEGTRPQSAKP